MKEKVRDVKKEDIGRNEAISRNTARHKRRRRRNLKLYYFMLAIVTVSVVAVLSLTVFFKVTNIEVSGECPYPEGSVIASSGIKKGDNLLMINRNKIENKLLSAYLNIDSVKIKKRLPSSVIIETVPAKALFAVSAENGYAVVSEKGKVLEIVPEAPEELMMLLGMKAEGISCGDPVGDALSGFENNVYSIYSEFSAVGISDIRSVEFISSADIRVSVGGRLLVKLGSEARLKYKAELVSKVIAEKIGETETGTIDASVPGTVGFLPD